jgi:DNA primase
MSDAVRQIKDKLNILDVISPYVELHKAGKNYKGKSPFAAEKTPSFYVSPDRGMYYCFSTSQGGDIFNFIQAMEGVDFKESLKMLAVKAGVELVPEDPKKKSERERLFAVLEAATVFFSDELEKETEATEYLLNRGVKSETIAKWRIGYAPGPPKHGWREAKDHLESLGYTRDELLKGGIIKTTDAGKEPFDVFRDRIVFPMAEPGGKMVAFSGRILHPDDKAPKYVNSPETDLYKKSDLLYGYDKAKTGIRNLNFSLIVEGQFDVVMCHQAGYSNTVAVSGTALTLHHVQLLERMSDKVVLALDADKAGISAMKKGAQLMLGRGLDVKVAELPLGKDPADLIQVNPVDFKHIIGKSVHVIEFFLHVIKREVTDERSFKLKVREEVLPFILLLPSRIDQEHFVGKVAEYIHSTTEAIRYELDRLREDRKNAPSGFSEAVKETVPEVSNNTNSLINARTFLLAALEVVPEDLRSKVLPHLEAIDTSEFEAISESDFAGVVFALEQQFAHLPKLALQEELVAKLNQLKLGMIRKSMTQARKQLHEIEQSGNDDDLAEVMQMLAQHEKQLREPKIGVDIFT